MKHPIKTLVLAFVAVVIVGTPCLTQDESHSAWKRLPDMAVPPNGATPQPGMWVRSTP